MDGWVTSDLYCAHARGNSVIKIKPPQKGRSAFVIEPGARFQADLDGWRTNQAIPIRDFIDSVHVLKACVKRQAMNPAEALRLVGGPAD